MRATNPHAIYQQQHARKKEKIELRQQHRPLESMTLWACTVADIVAVGRWHAAALQLARPTLPGRGGPSRRQIRSRSRCPLNRTGAQAQRCSRTEWYSVLPLACQVPGPTCLSSGTKEGPHLLHVDSDWGRGRHVEHLTEYLIFSSKNIKFYDSKKSIEKNKEDRF